MVMDSKVRSYNGRKYENGTDNQVQTVPVYLNPLTENCLGNVNHDETSLESDSTEDFDFSDVVLKYINHILMEEDVEDKSCMFLESASLQAAEKSFYDVLNEQSPGLRNYQQVPNFDPSLRNYNRDGKFYGELKSHLGFVDTNTLWPDWSYDPNRDGFDRNYGTVNVSQSNSHLSHSSSSSSSTFTDGHVDSPISTLKVPDMFSDSQSAMQFKKGVEEARKFLPNSNNLIVPNSSTFTDGHVDSPISTLKVPDMSSDSQSAMQFKKGVEEARKFLPNSNNLIVDLSYDKSLQVEKKEGEVKMPVKVKNNLDNEESRGKKNSYDERSGSHEERSNKQFAVYTESTVSSAMFDKVLLCSGGKNESDLRKALKEVTKKLPSENNESKGSTNGKGHAKKGRGSKKNVVDMRTLLTLCAQAVAADDRRTANEFLRQIREHATPTGDGMQRLAHYFAAGLEARMAGSGTKIYTSLINLPTSAADILKAYHIYLATCPFRKISNFFANKTIMNVSEKATRLHIIDFGILYGFQWPCFLQRLSTRPGGPPKLRITGIDLPCPGFRPSERVEETGRRLASYAETFKVPFEFTAIAQKWETIKLEDLRIEKDEVLVVNCLYRFRNLLDETVVVNSPRNTVLNLIRKMNPSVFVLGIVNGAYNAPFFITRFREALFHFSSFFDMLEANIPREIHERMLLERTVFGREAMNVIACEAAERIERPETYKQWQVRNMRAGFEQLPLDREIMKMAKDRVKSSYHKDFVIDEDGRWMLQGWKGRIVYALSSWRPAY